MLGICLGIHLPGGGGMVPAGGAMLGAVWEAPDPVAALEAALAECDRLNTQTQMPYTI